MLNWITFGLLLLVVGSMPLNSFYLPGSYSFTKTSFSTCDLFVDAGPDTNVCDPGGLIGLQGSIEGNAVYFEWSPSTGLNNPLVLNPVANITDPITYTLTAFGIDADNPNLVINGDFELGNTGFSSDYNYVADIPGFQMEMFPEGTYTVINNPNLVHTGFSACNDHTGGGNMMVINGAASLQDIWCQTIPISPNSWYNISAWVASVNSASPAKLRFSINGTPIGNIVNAPSTPCLWIPFNATWNSGSDNSATICILNLNTALGGNDFAIDDISLVALCEVEDDVEITLYEEEAPEPIIDGPAFLCEGEIGTYTADFPPDPVIFTYEWTVPSGATILNGQGTPNVNVLWDEPQEASLCLMITTRCDFNESCFEVTVGTVPELPLISGPASICPGEVTSLYTAEIDPDDVYQWTVPSEVTILGGNGTNELEIAWASPGEAEICLEVTNACGATDNCTFLNLLPSSMTLFDTVLCQGTTITINGNTYGNGTWSGVEHFIGANGCDSIVEVEVSEASVLEFMITEYLCPGDSVFLQGAFQTQPGTYMDSFTTVSNCDSLVITELIISPFDTTWIISSTCDPALAGTTVNTFAQGNCDSTVITEVLLVPADTTTILLASCSPADTGQITMLFTNQSGCDSLVIQNTVLLSSDTTLFFQTTCDPSQVGSTSQAFVNVFGCDSVVTTTTTFLESDTTLISLHTCMHADTGTVSTLLTNHEGCDSLVVITTTYVGSDTTFLSATTCTPSDSGTFIFPLANQFGCDSIVSIYTRFLASDTTYISRTSCIYLDTGIVNQLLTNIEGCDSLVITTTTLQPVDECQIQALITVEQPNCYGDPANVMVDIQIGLGPFQLTWVHQDFIGVIDYPSPGIYSFPFDISGVSYIELTSANGLSLLDTIIVDTPLPLHIETHSGIDINGYDLRCHGDITGEALVNILSEGTPPLLYIWSDGSTNQMIENLAAGLYIVTVTDSHGCETSDSIELIEPPAMQYEIITDDINCFGQQNGSISVTAIQGGVQPWMTSLDGNLFQPSVIYMELEPGNHELVIMDQNGCSFDEPFSISEPEDWSIDLGPDTTLAFGSNFELTAILTGQPKGMLQMSWSDEQCDNCLSRNIEATSNTIYEILATDENGCTSHDEIKINVYIDRDLFIPNIFSPNEDQINDQFVITSGAGLEEIEELTIFDRWGNLVYQEFHIQPNDPNFSWDGHMNGILLNPGVFVYKLIVVYKDSRRETRFGDVTLIR